MEDMRKTLACYVESRQKIQERINELHKEIADAKDSERSGLVKRRYQLYTMVWELDHSIREMCEYLDDSPAMVNDKAS